MNNLANNIKDETRSGVVSQKQATLFQSLENTVYMTSNLDGILLCTIGSVTTRPKRSRIPPQEHLSSLKFPI